MTFKDKLGVTCKSVGRIHRIGKAGPKRPVILFFQDFNEKSAVLKNAKKLKGTTIFVQNDYSKQTLKKRKLLLDSAKEEKSQGRNVYLVHDKLHVDKEVFVWNEAANARRKITRRDQQAHAATAEAVVSNDHEGSFNESA